jgi:hypothetical protein
VSAIECNLYTLKHVYSDVLHLKQAPACMYCRFAKSFRFKVVFWHELSGRCAATIQSCSKALSTPLGSA